MKKKKILLFSDDMRMSSGVGTMSREIVIGTAHHFDWVQVGGAIQVQIPPDWTTPQNTTPATPGYATAKVSERILPGDADVDRCTAHSLQPVSRPRSLRRLEMSSIRSPLEFHRACPPYAVGASVGSSRC